MGIMDWFRQAAGDKAATTTAAPSADDRGVEVGGLNFKSAIDAHMKWKMRLESYIDGTSNEDLQVDVISRDDQCPLGKWIYSRGGADFGYAETFFDMKTHHANFHRCAGAVLRTAQAGQRDEALALLHYGDYVRSSERVKKLLARLFVLVSDGKTAIDAHVQWNERLHDYIAGRGGVALDAATVSRNDACALGAWIAGEGQQTHGRSPAFAQLKAAHNAFHACAGEIVVMADHHRSAEALENMESGAYAKASDAVTVALVDLFSTAPA